jgi:PIN domain nuclease of toxin-antitoxin system
MRALLDTHAFLWWVLDDAHLSDAGRDIIGDGSNEVIVSAATAHEIGIKAASGRLALPEPPEIYVPSRIRSEGFAALAIDVAHALRAARLPMFHRDPWDRLLIAQAQVEGLPIITPDPVISRYDVETIW